MHDHTQLEAIKRDCETIGSIVANCIRSDEKKRRKSAVNVQTNLAAIIRTAEALAWQRDLADEIRKDELAGARILLRQLNAMAEKRERAQRELGRLARENAELKARLAAHA